MKCNKRKALALAGALIASVSLTGCGLLQQTQQIMQNNTTQNSSTSIIGGADGPTSIITGSDGSGSNSNTVSDDTKLSFSEIEKLAETGIYTVQWETEDYSFGSGTAFVMDSAAHGKVLVSAFHFLIPDDDASFSGKDLPSYITGGSIYNAYNFDETGASLKNCVVIKDAATSPKTEKDVSAFTVYEDELLTSLPLSTHKPQPGDTVYLLANLMGNEDYHENCVYEGTVISDSNGIFTYNLDEKYSTAGGSGAPIVNEYGEVVAIHMGSKGSIRIANSVTSFSGLVENGTVSDITYDKVESETVSNIFGSDGTDYSDANGSTDLDDVPSHMLIIQETMSTTFFDLSINSVSISTDLNGNTAPEGYQFATINVTLQALDSEPVDMYYSDFAVLFSDDTYCEPLESGYTADQLPDEYTITNRPTTGDLVFLVPLSEEGFLFDYVDYYTYEGDDEFHYNGIYDIIIPAENWTRSDSL